MLVAFIFTGWTNRASFWAGAPSFLVFFLLVLLGWRVFGPPIHG